MKAWGWVCLVIGLLTFPALPGLALIGVVLLLVAIPRERRERRVEKLIAGLPDLRKMYVHGRPQTDRDPNVRAYQRVKKRRRGLGPGLRERPITLVAWLEPGEKVIPTSTPWRNDPSMGYGLFQFVPESHPFPVVSGQRSLEAQQKLDRDWLHGRSTGER